MKCLLLGLLLVSTSLFAQEMTIIDADYRCEQPGGGIAFKTDPAARIWQTDVGEAFGLELKVQEFVTDVRHGSFKFRATIFNQIMVRGVISSLKLTYEMLSPETLRWEPLLTDVKCVQLR